YESIRKQVPQTKLPSAAHASADLHRTMDIYRPSPSRHRLRVGVLSFREIDCKEALGFSLGHEIATGLARFRWFDVIGPATLRPHLLTTGRYEYANLDYVVDGTICGRGRLLRIDVRLLDLAGEARPILNEQFEIVVSHLHGFAELIAARIVERVDPAVLHIEGRPKRREHHAATGLLL